MDVEAAIIKLSQLSDCWVNMRGEHFGIEGCVVKSTDGKGALVSVRWRMRLSLAVMEVGNVRSGMASELGLVPPSVTSLGASAVWSRS